MILTQYGRHFRIIDLRGSGSWLITLKQMHVESTGMHLSLSFMKLVIPHLFAILKFTFRTSQENMAYCFDVLQMQKKDIFPELYQIQPPAMNKPPSASNFQELVMGMCSDLFHTGRMVIGDRLHSAIDTAEMLYEKKLTESKQ